MFELELKENAAVNEIIECIKGNRINPNCTIVATDNPKTIHYYDLSQEKRKDYDSFKNFQTKVLTHFGLNNPDDKNLHNRFWNITGELGKSNYGKNSKINSLAFYFLLNPNLAVKSIFYVLDITGMSENQISSMTDNHYVALPEIFTKDLLKYEDKKTRKIDEGKLSSDYPKLEKEHIAACKDFYAVKRNDVITVIKEGKVIAFFDKIDFYKYVDVLIDCEHKSCHRRSGRWMQIEKDIALDMSSFHNGIFEEVVDEKIIDDLYLRYVEVINEIENRPKRSTKKTTSLKKGPVESKMKKQEPIVGYNKLLYGLPGCGKSYRAKLDCGSDESLVTRVIFHPDYTNADFVGQILPRVKDGKLSYEFVPGPFARALKAAFLNKNKMHYLIIEELNRGNAPAIFGELFQLLDRLDADSKTNSVKKAGASEYEIENWSVAEYVFGDANKNVFVPNNLSIIATMNTSDQNVFTLDTAFQRRWEMERIKNDYDKFAPGKALKIAKTGIAWVDFVRVINSELASTNMSFTSTEDKGLGLYFAKVKEIEDAKRFAEKVLKYLWDDAFKMNKEQIFELVHGGEHWDLAKIQEEFEKTGKFDGIIIDSILSKMKGSK